MGDGNSDKGEHSTKGIKAANEIVINAGTINIKAYDDGLILTVYVRFLFVTSEI